MKAIVCDRYGPPEVLRLAEVARPDPKSDEILIRTHAAAVTLGDCEVRAFKVAGWIWLPLRLVLGLTRLRQPILGLEIAGEVAAVGDGVEAFAVGDRVFGSTGFGMGAYAEYKCVRADGPVTRIPDVLSYAEAAGIPTGGLNALHFLRHAGVKAGDRVLINGAGGSIGTFAVQLAKHFGAEVTAVDRGDKLAMLRDLGADHVIDYQNDDFTTRQNSFDVIIEIVGSAPFAGCMRALRSNGRYVLGNPRFGHMVRGLWASWRTDKTVLMTMAGEVVADLDYLKDLVAAGTIRVVIDRHFALAETADAHRYVEAGHKRGVVILDVADA